MTITEGSKWVKIAFEYTRFDGGMSGRTQGNPIRLKKITFENVKNAVIEWVQNWTGKGQIEIFWLETGPFREDQLIKNEMSFFENKIYKFNN